ncbi:hypothetical protein A9P82_03940 [Arachidicoccus ginsenosidimutans]|uniref:tetratricopeptide repeat protein n=1 Tax=Arachidicoccus sp. BS20 TaxID=1850526 RepID=UPI0007F0F038|nr:hypothetical protein [Arachidicoccus sp. BS20]ANI88523.1 hypothetical protein A9P82_03940 [Arachidicoccus sp. BS20]
MKFYNFIIKYRFWLSLLLAVIAIVLNITGVAGFWAMFPLYFIAFIGLLSHFLIGPMRLIQKPMEDGNIEEVQKIMSTIWFPNLLIKPVRSTYYTLKGNIAMMNKDFDEAEKHLKKSSSIGSAVPEADGANKLQLGMMAMQRGDMKAAEGYLRAALKIGIPDNESKAVANLGMCQIMMNRREFRAAKDFFRRAQACKPTTPEVVSQIKEIQKYISRVPG